MVFCLFVLVGFVIVVGGVFFFNFVLWAFFFLNEHKPKDHPTYYRS